MGKWVDGRWVTGCGVWGAVFKGMGDVFVGDW